MGAEPEVSRVDEPKSVDELEDGLDAWVVVGLDETDVDSQDCVRCRNLDMRIGR